MGIFDQLKTQLRFDINEENLPVRAEQMRARLRMYPLMIASQLLVSGMLCWLMWDKVGHARLAGWLCVLFLVHAVESARLWRTRGEIRTVAECEVMRNSLVLFAVLPGVMWAAGDILMFVPGDLAYQSMLMCVVLGMGAAAVTTNPVFPPALYIFEVLLLLPIAYANLMAGDTVHFILAFLLVVFLVYVLNAGRELAETFELSLRRAQENAVLVDRLTVENRRAEQASAYKSKFLAAASHDLRQPVHALTLFVASLKAHRHEAETQYLVNRIAHSVDVLGDMFDSLLDLSKLDAGAVQPHLRSFEAGELLRRIALDFEVVAQEKSLRLYVEPCALSIHSDPALLERVFRNLVSNALRYTHFGQVKVTHRLQGAALHFDISDTGMGISPEHMQHIFEEYYQAGNAQRDRNQGLGLGLAIVKRLDALLGLGLSCDSSVGKGSCFSFRVPLACGDARAAA